MSAIEDSTVHEHFQIINLSLMTLPHHNYRVRSHDPCNTHLKIDNPTSLTNLAPNIFASGQSIVIKLLLTDDHREVYFLMIFLLEYSCLNSASH